MDEKFEYFSNQTLETNDKEFILNYIVSYKVSLDFIDNNRDLFGNTSDKFSKSSWWSSWGKCVAGTLGGAITGALGGAAIGSAVPVIGTTAGGIVGAVGGALTGARRRHVVMMSSQKNLLILILLPNLLLLGWALYIFFKQLNANELVIWKLIASLTERQLGIRVFSDSMKQKVYENQIGICVECKDEFALSRMEGDHITPWHEGGKTIEENCQMLAKIVIVEKAKVKNGTQQRI